MRDIPRLLTQAVGPFAHFCCGCGMEPEAAYVTTPLIGIGVVPSGCSHSGSCLLDQTLAFDRAEAETANITQTNMVTVSSFNGVQGLLLGYDLLKQPFCPHPRLTFPHIQVLDAAPLFAATQALFGTVQAPRFPISPGQHLLCAAKTLYTTGPCLVYGALAIAIAQERACQADLFLEDLGTLMDPQGDKESLSVCDTLHNQETLVVKHLIDAVDKIGHNIGVRYTQVFVGFRSCRVAAGECACVLTAVPYIRLAQRAVPDNQSTHLESLDLKQWEAAVRPYFLQPSP